MNHDRDNTAWLHDLQSTGQTQETALTDLRESLLRSVRGPLSNRAQINDSFLEDIIQDTLLLILDRLHQFEGRSRFLTWSTSIAIHQAMSKLRRAHWNDVSLEQVLSDSAFPEFGETETTSEQETETQRQAIIKQMHHMIETELTEKQRQALLAELKGMPQDEIARHLGSNRNAIYKLTHDARKRLKSGLESAGVNLTDVNAAFST